MSGLRELQRDFAASLGGAAVTALEQRIAPGRFSPAQRLNIFRNNYTITLREALAATYPVTRQLLGEAFFNDLAGTYLRAHPCRGGNLHDFGGELHAALAADARLADYPYLPDVAALEWACHRSFHGPDAAALDLARLQAWPAEAFGSLHFSLHPCCRLLRSEFPVLSIWQAHQPAASGAPVDFAAGPEQVLVSRPQLDVELHRLPGADFALLQALHDDATLEQAVQGALALDPGFDLETRLGALVLGAVLVDVRA